MASDKPTRLVTWVDYGDNGQPQPIDYSDLYKAMNLSSELFSVVSAVVDDTISEGFVLLGDSSKVESMTEWLDKIAFSSTLRNALFDMILTGNGYMEITSVRKRDVYRILDKVADRINLKKTYGYWKLADEIINNKPLFKLYNIDASSIYIDYDEKGNIKRYLQAMPESHIPIKELDVDTYNEGSVSMSYKFVSLPKDKVIHLPYVRLAGSIYGTSPALSVQNDIASLLYAKTYASKFFANSGVPDWIFILRDENPAVLKENYEIVKKELKSFKNMAKKHSNLILTGDIEAKELNKFNKDLEFANYIEMATQRILMAFRMPPARVSLKASSGDNNKQAFEGYYKSISAFQKTIEDILNNQLFSKYGVKFVFNRTYKVDELREAQIISMLLDRGVISQQEARDRLGFKGEIQHNPITNTQDGVLPNPPTSSKPQPAPMKEQNESTMRPQDAKPPKKMAELALEKGDKPIYVDFEYFVQIVESAMPFRQAKILYQEYDDHFILLYADKAFKYKTRVDKADIDVEDFRYEYLINAIPVILED